MFVAGFPVPFILEERRGSAVSHGRMLGLEVRVAIPLSQ